MNFPEHTTCFYAIFVQDQQSFIKFTKDLCKQLKIVPLFMVHLKLEDKNVAQI